MNTIVLVYSAVMELAVATPLPPLVAGGGSSNDLFVLLGIGSGFALIAGGIASISNGHKITYGTGLPAGRQLVYRLNPEISRVKFLISNSLLLIAFLGFAIFFL